MKQLNYQALGQRIRQARQSRNITQEKLGELVGLSTAHIGHIERGTRVPSLDTVYRIATELEVSIDHLLLDSTQSPNQTFAALSAMLATKSEAQVRSFLTAVKALADNIDGF